MIVTMDRRTHWSQSSNKWRTAPVWLQVELHGTLKDIQGKGSFWGVGKPVYIQFDNSNAIQILKSIIYDVQMIGLV